jgi:hypothetical protein
MSLGTEVCILLATQVVNLITAYRIATGNRMFFKMFVFQSAVAAAI